MTWDVAIRIGGKIRVFQRNAQEFIGMTRLLDQPNPDAINTAVRTAVRESALLYEGNYDVYDDGPDTILEIGKGIKKRGPKRKPIKGNAVLTMAPQEARNISQWLTDLGWRIRDEFFPDMNLRPSVANLTDKNEQDRIAQRRRDSTAVFGG